jgi:hypothetical protein
MHGLEVVVIVYAVALLVLIGWAIRGDSPRKGLPLRRVWDEAKREKMTGHPRGNDITAR